MLKEQRYPLEKKNGDPLQHPVVIMVVRVLYLI
jgi:hypothetical protein